KANPDPLARDRSGDLPLRQGAFGAREEARRLAPARLRVFGEGLLRQQQVRPEAGSAPDPEQAARDPEHVLPERQSVRVRLHRLDGGRGPEPEALPRQSERGRELPRSRGSRKEPPGAEGFRKRLPDRNERDSRGKSLQPPN